MEQPNQLSNSFFKLASFTMAMLSIAIFFGSIFFIMWYGVPMIETQQQAFTMSDIVTKAFLTAIFVLLFAIMMMQSYIVKIIEKKNQ